MSLPNGAAAPYIIQNGNIYQLASGNQLIPRNAIRIATATMGDGQSAPDEAKSVGDGNVILSLGGSGASLDQTGQFQIINAGALTTQQGAASAAGNIKFAAFKGGAAPAGYVNLTTTAAAASKARKIIYKTGPPGSDAFTTAAKSNQIQLITSSNMAAAQTLQHQQQQPQIRTINLFQPQPSMTHGLGPSQAKQFIIANGQAPGATTKLSAILNNHPGGDLKAAGGGGKVLLSATGAGQPGQSPIFVLAPANRASSSAGGTFSTATLPNGQNVQVILQPKQVQVLQAAPTTTPVLSQAAVAGAQMQKVYRPITSTLNILKPTGGPVTQVSQGPTSPGKKAHFEPHQQAVQYFLSSDGTELISSNSDAQAGFSEMALIEALNSNRLQQHHQPEQLSGISVVSASDLAALSKTATIRQHGQHQYIMTQSQQQQQQQTMASAATSVQSSSVEQQTTSTTTTTTTLTNSKTVKSTSKASKIREIGNKMPPQSLTPIQRQSAGPAPTPSPSASASSSASATNTNPTSSSTSTTNINSNTNNTNIIINNNTNNIIINNNTNNFIINNANFSEKQNAAARSPASETTKTVALGSKQKRSSESSVTAAATGTECTISIKDSIKKAQSENFSSDKARKPPGEASIEDYLNEFILPDTRIFASLMNKDTNANANGNKRSLTDFTYKSVMIGNTEHIILDNANNLSDFQGDLHKLKEIACALASKLNKPVTIPAFLLLQETAIVDRIREFLNEKNINPIIIDTNSTTCNESGAGKAGNENHPKSKSSSAKDPHLKKALKNEPIEAASEPQPQQKQTGQSKSNTKRKLSQCNVPVGQVNSTQSGGSEAASVSSEGQNQGKPASKRPRQRKSTLAAPPPSESPSQQKQQQQLPPVADPLAELPGQQFQQAVHVAVNYACNSQDQHLVQETTANEQHQIDQTIDKFTDYLNDQMIMQSMGAPGTEVTEHANEVKTQKTDSLDSRSQAAQQMTGGQHHFESYESFKIDFIDENNYSGQMNQMDFMSHQQQQHQMQAIESHQQQQQQHQAPGQLVEASGGEHGAVMLNGADFGLDNFDPNGFFNLNMSDLNYSNIYQSA